MSTRRWSAVAAAAGVVWLGSGSVAQAQHGHCCCMGGMSRGGMMGGQGMSLTANPYAVQQLAAVQQLVAMQQMQQLQAAADAAAYQQQLTAQRQQQAARQQQLAAAQRAAARQATLTAAANLPPTRIQQEYNDQMRATQAQIARRRAAAQQQIGQRAAANQQRQNQPNGRR